MNKKTFFGAVCALACATNFLVAQPHADAMASAHEQEKWARHLEEVVFGGPPKTSSEEAIRATPIIQGLQKRMCDRNGIEMTTIPFQNAYDFETKIHPMQVVDDYNNAFSSGAGYIYCGKEFLKHESILDFSEEFDYIAAEEIIAHEMGHSLGGHTMSKKFNKNAELLAETKAVELLDKLPEGGWGAYLAAARVVFSRPEEVRQIENSFVKECGGKIRISSPSEVFYRTKAGREIRLQENSGNQDSWYNAYFGGQIAYCIAKDALKPENIVIEKNFLKDEIKFQGDYLLVCRSSNLPNGYRVLTNLYGGEKNVMDDWNQAQALIFDWCLVDNYERAANETCFSNGNENPLKMWTALAVALDLLG